MSTLPLPLFDDRPLRTPAGGTLVPRSGKNDPPLSKRQQAVSRLLKRVEKLRGVLENERRRLDDALIFHAAHLRPRQERVLELRTQVVRTLRPFLTDRRLNPADRRALQTLLAAQLDEVLGNSESPDQDLRELFGILHGVGYEEAVEDELEAGRAAMGAMFEDLGLDIDVTRLRADMTEEEIAVMMAETAEQLRRQEAERAARRSTGRLGKRAQREEKRMRRFEEARKISAGAIYKRLVKALHPDLESDPARRERKIALMQEVTTAYAGNDLHSLLRLEYEVNGGTAAEALQASDETLDACAELLKNQAAALEEERAHLRFHPRYEPLHREDELLGIPMLVDGPAEAHLLDTVIAALEAALADMASGSALTVVRGLVQEQRRAERARAREYRRRR